MHANELDIETQHVLQSKVTAGLKIKRLANLLGEAIKALEEHEEKIEERKKSLYS